MQPYLDLLRTILDHGKDRADRTGTGTRGIFGQRVVSRSKVFGVEIEPTERAEDRELGKVRDASCKGRALLEGGHPG